jgi:ArsR family transcriptional regulator, zinc-responsive transcriptional repressor
MPEHSPCAAASTELPSADETQATVRLLTAMAHPIRVRVLLTLGRNDPMSVGELQQCLDVEQSALSHQLRALRDAGLVVGERSGKRVIYRLDDHHVAHIVEDALAHAIERHELT